MVFYCINCFTNDYLLGFEIESTSATQLNREKTKTIFLMKIAWTYFKAQCSLFLLTLIFHIVSGRHSSCIIQLLFPKSKKTKRYLIFNKTVNKNIKLTTMVVRPPLRN